jgi:hypothetical protein
MAYDEVLAGRIRDLIGPDPELAEKKMFGGLAFASMTPIEHRHAKAPRHSPDGL